LGHFDFECVPYYWDRPDLSKLVKQTEDLLSEFTRVDIVIVIVEEEDSETDNTSLNPALDSKSTPQETELYVEYDEESSGVSIYPIDSSLGEVRGIKKKQGVKSEEEFTI
jgi:hypothetical protein